MKQSTLTGRNSLALTGLFLGGVFEFFLLFVDARVTREYEVTWSYAPATPYSERHVVLECVEAPRNRVHLYSPDLGAKLEGLQRSRLKVTVQNGSWLVNGVTAAA